MRSPTSDTFKFLRRSTAIGMLFLAAGTAFADNSKISPDLLPLLSNPNSSINVLVQYQPQSLLGGILGGVTNLLNGVWNTACTLSNAATATLKPVASTTVPNPRSA